MPDRFFCAGIAQLVERNLAKVEVGSSRLLSRSKISTRTAGAKFIRTEPAVSFKFTAGWQSGYAAACKAVDAGSIPTPASKQNQALKKIARDSTRFFGTIWDSSL